MSNAQIAERLYLKESTAKQHLRAAYKLLKLSNRVQAAKLTPRADAYYDNRYGNLRYLRQSDRSHRLHDGADSWTQPLRRALPLGTPGGEETKH